MQGRIRTGRAQSVSFTASVSWAHCDHHSGLCATEDIQAGTPPRPSWGYWHSSSHFGLHALSCLHTKSPSIPYLSTRVSPHSDRLHMPYSHLHPHTPRPCTLQSLVLLVPVTPFRCISTEFQGALSCLYTNQYLPLSLLNATFPP